MEVLTAQTSIIETFEDLISAPGTPLSDAMGHLSELAGGRGTCVCFEHPDHGITVIADAHWNHSGLSTMRHRRQHAVFSLKGHAGFDTISVLVGDTKGQDRPAMQADCAIAAAAIGLVTAVSATNLWRTPNAILAA